MTTMKHLGANSLVDRLTAQHGAYKYDPRTNRATLMRGHKDR